MSESEEALLRRAAQTVPPMHPREAADMVAASWLNADAMSHVPLGRALGVLVDHARRSLSGGDVATARVAALVADLEALDEKFPGHLRTLIGPQLCDDVIAALSAVPAPVGDDHQEGQP